jgi:hypothetical protein
VFAGHAALALLAKSKRPNIPIALLVPVAFAPDWIQLFADALHHYHKQISHSLVSVAIGATAVALVYLALTRARTDAMVVWLTYASHWPADFITGKKPTWPGGPTVGLLLYAHPLGDVLVESAVIVLCWLAYRRSLPEASRKRAINFLVPLGLIGLQIVFEAVQSPDFG